MYLAIFYFKHQNFLRVMMPKSSPVRCTIPALVAVAYKREQHQKHFTGGIGVEPAKHPPKVKSEIFLQL